MTIEERITEVMTQIIRLNDLDPRKRDIKERLDQLVTTKYQIDELKRKVANSKPIKNTLKNTLNKKDK